MLRFDQRCHRLTFNRPAKDKTMPVIFTNARSVTVTILTFNQIDTAYTTPLIQFEIRPKERFRWDAETVPASAPGWDRTNFQISLQEGAQQWERVSPSPNKLFRVGDTLLVTLDGDGLLSIRRFVHPSLTITTPEPNVAMSQSRLGQDDNLEATLNVNDWNLIGLPIRFVTPENYFSMLRVEFLVNYQGPGQPQASSPIAETSRDLTQLPTAGTARFRTKFKFGRSGPVQVSCRLISTDPIVDSQTTARVSAQVAATQPRQINAQFIGAIANTSPPAFPAVSSMILCTLTVGAEHYFPDDYSIEYQYGRSGAVGINGIWTKVKAQHIDGSQTRSWQVALPIAANLAPGTYSLVVRGEDAFEEETRTGYPFELRDVTPPEISIERSGATKAGIIVSPMAALAERHVQATDDPAALVINFAGSVRDLQSGFKDASLSYNVGGSDQAVTVSAGTWLIQLTPGTFGAFELRMTAEDNAGNRGTKVHRFEVVSAYRPANLGELLGPHSYLRELQRFANAQLKKADGTSVTLQDLEAGFGQPFLGFNQPNSAEATESACDLLVPVRLLRRRAPASSGDAAAALVAVSPLIGRWTFAELADGAMDGLIDRFQGFGSFTLTGSYWTSGGATSSATGVPAKRLTGKPGSGDALEGAFISTQTSFVRIGTLGTNADWTRQALKLGGDNRDFSLAFWVWPEDQGAGQWRGVLFKGTEQPVVSRTPSIWLHPNENRVHFRISTAAERNDGGDSVALLPTRRWSHLAYVKRGRCLRLYIDGLLDKEVTLKSANILENDEPVYLGANPHYPGFRGGLSEFRIYGLALEEDDVRRLATVRGAGIPGTDKALYAYCRNAHAALLRGLGTSLEELSTLGGLTPGERTALETRLGMTSPPGQPGTALQALLPTGTPSVQQFEIFLTSGFGLPPTVWDTTNQPPLSGTPLVLWYRQAGLELAWASDDANAARWPDLDPDLVDFAELNPDAVAWRALHIARSGEVEIKFRELSDRSLQPSDLISKVFTQSESDRLRALNTDDAAGRSIAEGIATLALNLPMFRRLLTYLERPAGTPLSPEQYDDLGHLLVEAWKRRVKHAAWIQEESQLATRPWPSVSGDGAWLPGRGKSDFLPWRASARRRAALEARLAGRHRDWSALIQSHARLVIDVQRATLPALRDDLLGISDLPQLVARLGPLAQHLLTDTSASGGLELSAADQAAASLQVLLNGVRQGWFRPGHPAAGWSVPDKAAFDKHWSAIDSWGRWKSSALNSLYPENTLYPELRRRNSQAFRACLQALRVIQPLTLASLEDTGSPYGGKIQNLLAELLQEGSNNNLVAAASLAEEFYFLVPVSEGLAFQRAGQFRLARERYAQVFDVSSDVSMTTAARRKVEPIRSEPVGEPARGSFVASDWTADLNDPHARASKPSSQRNGCANPYTRFVLFQILRCLLDEAAAAHAGGTVDGLALARSLYLEAEDILAFEELDDVPPTQGGEAYLPNPVLQALRSETAAGLRKLRLGLSSLGTPLPPDPTRGAAAAGFSSLVRPTPYRYRVLVERAKQYTELARQFEAQYLSALERNDAELEQLMRQGFALSVAEQTQSLRNLGITESENGKKLAGLQQQRSRIEADSYADRLVAGDNYYEREELTGIQKTSNWRQDVNRFQTAAAVSQAIGSGIGVEFWKAYAAAVQAGSVALAGVAQGRLIDQEATNQTNALLAARQRRNEEWQLRRDIAEQDWLIGKQGAKLADDRVAIAKQEWTISAAQTTQAAQMLAFVNDKFSNAEFYEWMAGVLAQAYAYFLQLASAAARQAEMQLAFQRQEPALGVVRSDYWKLASSDSSKDRRGITGTARLLQDLYTLDQYAFSSERRMLNLTQHFSLAQLMPVEFEEFRRTGVLLFETPMAWFDSGFPGHYLRLVKQVRVSLAALIPPSLGVRATLSNGGLSRVVTADPGYPTVVIRQDPQSIALTSPNGATGVFDLDPQAELLYPFEGSGVDTAWMLELPRPANHFDFDSLLDVVFSVDYTALFSVDLRYRVVKKLPREAVGQRVFSVRRDLPDVWYDLVNRTSTEPARITLTLSRQQFPSGIETVSIQSFAVSARKVDGTPGSFRVEPSVATSGRTTSGSTVGAVTGLVSSRQSGASTWRPLLGAGIDTNWVFRLEDDSNSPGFLHDLSDGVVEDVLVLFSFSGMRPAWTV